MKIKMIKNERASNDGIIIDKYIKGKVYDVSDILVDVFVNQMKVAEIYKEPVIEKKKVEVSENKMAKPKENKSWSKKEGK
jgi:hypothetical protein